MSGWVQGLRGAVRRFLDDIRDELTKDRSGESFEEAMARWQITNPYF